MEEQKHSYFQYNRDLSYPVYLKYQAGLFTNDILALMGQMRFSEVPENEAAQIDNELLENPKARVLTLTPASHIVSSQIDHAVESDRFGPESITPREGYKVYRYKGVGLMVYCHSHNSWELGCYEDFGSEENLLAYRSVINRYLSWALAPFGVIGLWGVPVDEGVVILKQRETQGEAIFLDLKKRQMLSVDGVKRIPSRFKILRLDSQLKGKNIKMKSDELLSFLSTHCSHLDPQGHPIPVRQMLQTVSKMAEGLIHPQESFKPRTDLSP